MRIFVFTCLVLFALVSSGFAQDSLSEQVDGLGQRVDSLEAAFSNAGKDDAKLAVLGGDADTLRDEIFVLLQEQDPVLDEAVKALEQLGEAPTDSTEPVDETLAIQRTDLTKRVQLLQSHVVSLRDMLAATRDIRNDISALRRDSFANTVLKKTPLSSNTFSLGLAAYGQKYTEVRLLARNWLVLNATNNPARLFGSLLAGLVVAFVVLQFIRKTINVRLARNAVDEAPPVFTQLNLAFWKSVLGPLLYAVGLLTIYFLMNSLGLFGPKIAELSWLLIVLLTGIIFIWSLSTGVLAPSRPHWRLVPVTSDGATKLRFLVLLLALVFAFDYVGQRIAVSFDAPLEFTVLTGLIAAAMQGTLLLLIAFMKPLRGPFPQSTHRERMDAQFAATTSAPAAEVEPSLHPDMASGVSWPLWLRLPLFLCALILIVSALIGYVALASFLSRQIVVTGAILTSMYLGYIASRELGKEGVFASTRSGEFTKSSLGFTDRWVEQSGLFIGLLGFMAVLAVGLPLIALQWGVQPVDIWLFVGRVFTGIEIGNFRLSLSGILFGIAIFVAGFFVTRLFQGGLDRGVLARSGMDSGVRDSIRKGIGYAGIGLAALIGVTAAGVNLSSLAIVAGALSLGIGFGLQNIVSNFVSGLILLVERPIKVGDIITVGGYDGTVLEISVRATQLTTFDKKTVTIPNSELINGTVNNWTHRSREIRYDIPVGVSYGTDTRKVEDILLDIATSHELVLNDPEPWVMFKDFGASSLDFTLFIYLADLSNGVAVRNEVRHQIVEQLEKENISMPFPQRDVNIKMEQAETMVSAAKAKKPIKRSKPKQIEE